MSSSCPYDVGAPSDWLTNASLPQDSKACAIPESDGCGNNDKIISDCCVTATQSQDANLLPYNWIGNTTDGRTIRVCSLPDAVSNDTYQQYQDCVLNAQGREGGFRCNDPGSLNTGPHCNSLNGAISAPVSPPTGQQACVTGARANMSELMESCCGSAAIAFEGGCWQYCIGPANKTIGSCIVAGLNDMNITTSPVGCQGTQDATSTSAKMATTLDRLNIGSTVGLITVLAWSVGLL